MGGMMHSEATLPTVLGAKRIANWVNIASLVLWIAEYFELLDLEVKLIWPRNQTRWGPVKILFYMLRYLPALQIPLTFPYFMKPDLPTTVSLLSRVCIPYFIVIAAGYTINISLAQAMMFVRVLAVGGATRSLKIYLIAHYVISTAGIYGLLARYCSSLIYRSGDFLEYVGCLAVTTNNTPLAILYGVVLFNEMVMMALTAFIGYRKYIYMKNTPLLRIFYLDGTMYFVLLAAFSTANIFVNIFIGKQYAYTIAMLQCVLHNITAVRMLLCLRYLGSLRPSERTRLTRRGLYTEEPIELSAIRFREITSEDEEKTFAESNSSRDDLSDSYLMDKTGQIRDTTEEDHSHAISGPQKTAES